MKPQVVLSAYTKILMCKMPELQTYMEEVLGRPVWTHELGEPKIWEELKVKIRANGDLDKVLTMMREVWS